jgi:DNA-directed RNA polymerase subunit F
MTLIEELRERAEILRIVTRDRIEVKSLPVLYTITITDDVVIKIADLLDKAADELELPK